MSMFGSKVSDKQFAYAMQGHGIKNEIGEYKNHTLTMGQSTINLQKIARTTIPAPKDHLWTVTHSIIASEPKAAQLALGNMQRGAESLLKSLAVSARGLDAKTIVGKAVTIADALKKFSEKAPQNEDGCVKVLVRAVDEDSFKPAQISLADAQYLQTKPIEGKFGFSFEQMDLNGKTAFKTIDGTGGIMQQKTLNLRNVLKEVCKSEVGAMSDEALTSAITMFISPEMELLMSALNNAGKDENGKDAAMAKQVLTTLHGQIMEAHATRMHNKAALLPKPDQHDLARTLVEKVTIAENGRPEEAARVAAERKNEVIHDEEKPLMEKFDAALLTKHMTLPSDIKKYCNTLLLQFYLDSRPQLLQEKQKENNTEPVDKAANDYYVRDSIMDTVVENFLQRLCASTSPAEKQLGIYADCLEGMSVKFLSNDSFGKIFEEYTSEYFGPWKDFLAMCAEGEPIAAEKHTHTHSLGFQSLPADADISNPVEKIVAAVVREARQDLKTLPLQDIEKKYGTALHSGKDFMNFAMRKAALAIIKDAWNSALRPLKDVRCTRTVQDVLLKAIYSDAPQNVKLNDEQIRGAWSIAQTLSHNLRTHSDSDSVDAPNTVKNMLKSFAAEQNRVLQLLSPDADTQEKIRNLAFSIAVGMLKEADGLTSSESSPQELLDAAGENTVENFWEDPASLNKLLLENIPVPFSMVTVEEELEKANAQLAKCESRQSKALERKERADQTFESMRTLVHDLEQEMRTLASEQEELDSRIATARAKQITLSDQAESLHRDLPLQFAELGKTHSKALEYVLNKLREKLKETRPTTQTPNLAVLLKKYKDQAQKKHLSAQSKTRTADNIAKLEKELTDYKLKLAEFEKTHSDLAALTGWDNSWREFGDINTEEDMRFNAGLLEYAKGKSKEIQQDPNVDRALLNWRTLSESSPKSAALQKEIETLEQQVLSNTLHQSESGIKLRDAQAKLAGVIKEQESRLLQKEIDEASVDSNSALARKRILERQQQKMSKASGHVPDAKASSWQRIEEKIKKQLDLSANSLYGYLGELTRDTLPRVEPDLEKAGVAVMQDNLQLLKSEISVNTLEFIAKHSSETLVESAISALKTDDTLKHGAPLLRTSRNSAFQKAFAAELQQLLKDVNNKNLSMDTWKKKYGEVFSESQLVDGAIIRAARSVLDETLERIRANPQNKLTFDQDMQKSDQDNPKSATYTAATVFKILCALEQYNFVLPQDTEEKNCLFLLYAHTQLDNVLSGILDKDSQESDAFATLLLLRPALAKMQDYLEVLFPASKLPSDNNHKEYLWLAAGDLLKGALPKELKEILSSDATKDLCRHLKCMGSFRLDKNGEIIRPDSDAAAGIPDAHSISDLADYEDVLNILKFVEAFTGADEKVYTYTPYMVPFEPWELLKSYMPEFALAANGLRPVPLLSYNYPLEGQGLADVVRTALNNFKATEKDRGASVRDAPSMSFTRMLLDAMSMINIAENMGVKVNSDLVIRVLAGIGRPKEQVEEQILGAYSFAGLDLKQQIKDCLRPDLENIEPDKIRTVEERIIRAAQSIDKHYSLDKQGHIANSSNRYREFLLPPNGDPSALRQLRGEMERLWQDTSASYPMRQAYNALARQVKGLNNALSFEAFEEAVVGYMLDSTPQAEQQHEALKQRIVRDWGSIFNTQTSEGPKNLEVALASIAEAKRKHVELMNQYAQTDDTLSQLSERMNATPQAYTALRSLLANLTRLTESKPDNSAERIEDLFSPSNPVNIKSNEDRLNERLERVRKQYSRAKAILDQSPQAQQLMDTMLAHALEVHTRYKNNVVAKPSMDKFRTKDDLIKDMQRTREKFKAVTVRFPHRLEEQIKDIGELLSQAESSKGKYNAYVFEEKARRTLEAILSDLPQLYVGKEAHTAQLFLNVCEQFQAAHIKNYFNVKTRDDALRVANGPDGPLKDQFAAELPLYQTTQELQEEVDKIFPRLIELEKTELVL